MFRASHKDSCKRSKRKFKAKEQGLRDAKAICTEKRKALSSIKS